MLTWAGGLPSCCCAGDPGVQAVWLPLSSGRTPPQHHGVNLGDPLGWPCSGLLLGPEYWVMTPRKPPDPLSRHGGAGD